MSMGSSVTVFILWDSVSYTSTHIWLHWSLCDECLTLLLMWYLEKTKQQTTTKHEALHTW